MASFESSSRHIAMFPSPGMGHLIPFVNLAKLLLERRQISSATLILPAATAASPVLQSLPDTIHLHHLPPITTPADDDHQSPESQIFRSISLSLDSARVALADMAVAAVLVDPFGIDLRERLIHNVPVYMYFGTAAMNLLFMFHLSKFDAILSGQGLTDFQDSTDPFILPGCPPLHGRDFGDPFKTRDTPVFDTFLRIAEKSRSVNGILINTFTGLESGAISALKGSSTPPVFPIGPVVGSAGSGSGPVIEWLDGQPAGSVLYVSFGSGGAISHQQTTELALGLEESGERFVWVVRRPNDATSCPSYCNTVGSSEGSEGGFLPEGFEERTRGRGLVVEGWAPQVGVLGHVATGGFLTHCGWNSILESVVHGVPMLAWPLYAEQRTNAVVLSDGLGVGMRVRAGDGVVARGEVAVVVRRLMVDGDDLKKRAWELKEEARKAVEEGGSSVVELNRFGNSFKDALSHRTKINKTCVI